MNNFMNKNTLAIMKLKAPMSRQHNKRVIGKKGYFRRISAGYLCGYGIHLLNFHHS